MDRKISGSEIKKRKSLTYTKYVLIFILFVSGLFFVRNLLTTKAKHQNLYIVTVEKGDIQNTLTATGTVVPSMEIEVNAPVSTEIKRVVKSTGEFVHIDDLILELDQEYTRLAYDQLDDELQLKRNNVDKLKLEFDKHLRDLNYQNQIQALQLDELAALVKDKIRLRDVGGATDEDVEQAELQLKVDQLKMKMLENELSFRQSVNANEKRSLELEYTIQEKKLAELSRKLRETMVQAPQEGVITWINEDIGRKVSEGETLVRIANLKRYRVEASSSDRNSNTIDIGMPVKVRINNQELTGHIQTILPALENNTIKFHVQLDDPSSELLRPNIRAEVYIVTNSKTDIVRVKNGPAFSGASSQYLYVVEGNKAKRRRVSKGMSNSDYIEITDNLSAGEKVIISDMKDYDHLEEFIIKD